MTLDRRTLTAVFTLGTGDFGEGGENTVELTGYRMSANIQMPGGVNMTTLDLRIWGMPLDVMQKLTVLNILAFGQARRNVITLLAASEGTTPTVVFSGTLLEAWADASAPPDMLFVVSAQTGGFDSFKPVPPTSYSGSVDMPTILAGIGRLMEPARAVENNGVTAVFDNVYLPGTPIQQIRKACRMADCEYIITDSAIAIWPRGSKRGGSTLFVSPETGLVGYPRFSQSGLAFRLLFTPALIFGQQVEVSSVLGAACGSWKVAALSHTLEAELPGGGWFTDVECGLWGYLSPIITKV